MPLVQHEQLREIATQLFAAAGCGGDDARTVADHLVDSSLFGHDSHGAIRIYEYVDALADRDLPFGVYANAGRPEREGSFHRHAHL